MPTQEEIEEALLGIYNSSWSRDILAAAYRAKKARAELAERQYAELREIIRNDNRGLASIDARHEVERKALSGQPVDKPRNAEG
jgi:hypothetical protein